MTTAEQSDWIDQFEKELREGVRKRYPNLKVTIDFASEKKKEETPLQKQQRILREKYGDKKKKTPARKGGER